MKKIILGTVLVLSMVLFSGCSGGSSSDGDSGQTTADGYEVIDINYLSEGYEINGVNSRNENVTLLYCSDGHYEYYRDSEQFSGSYNIVRDEIQMIDSDGGSYVLETGNYYLEVDEIYPCDSLGRDLQITSIYEVNC